MADYQQMKHLYETLKKDNQSIKRVFESKLQAALMKFDEQYKYIETITTENTRLNQENEDLLQLNKDSESKCKEMRDIRSKEEIEQLTEKLKQCEKDLRKKQSKIDENTTPETPEYMKVDEVDEPDRLKDAEEQIKEPTMENPEAAQKLVYYKYGTQKPIDQGEIENINAKKEQEDFVKKLYEKAFICFDTFLKNEHMLFLYNCYTKYMSVEQITDLKKYTGNEEKFVETCFKYGIDYYAYKIKNSNITPKELVQLLSDRGEVDIKHVKNFYISIWYYIHVADTDYAAFEQKNKENKTNEMELEEKVTYFNYKEYDINLDKRDNLNSIILTNFLDLYNLILECLKPLQKLQMTDLEISMEIEAEDGVEIINKSLIDLEIEYQDNTFSGLINTAKKFDFENDGITYYNELRKKHADKTVIITSF